MIAGPDTLRSEDYAPSDDLLPRWWPCNGAWTRSQPPARGAGQVFTVHSRGAEQAAIERLIHAGVTAILHWYSGPLKHIDVALAGGLWFSVNPAMLASKNGKRIIQSIPRERVVTETDGPYTKTSGRPAEPRDIPAVVTGLARVWGEEPERARRRVHDNMSAVAAAASA